MKRKKFIKNCMAIGIGRNAANYLASCREPVTGTMMRRVLGRHQITNCQKVQGGAYIRLKLRKAGGGND